MNEDTEEGSTKAVLPQTGFPIVGIGASAGGLAALEAFFSAFPPDALPGMGFVVVQHLAPDHKSILSELVERYTSMPVQEARDNSPVLPNHVYVIPPNYDMACVNGTLHLTEPGAPRGHRLPIDFFLRSLAQDRHEHAICIILSGTGSDGTLGLRAIKSEGGMAIAQDPSTAAFDSMPRSAIASGLIDSVLPPAEMPAQLTAFANRAFAPPSTAAITMPRLEDSLMKILILVRAQTGHDFSGYKLNTILRRIQRRMALLRIDNPEDYLLHLRQAPAELDNLFRDFLIGVTTFFRDPASFEALAESVFPRLFNSKEPEAPIRVWVPGCSTGEEAYSLAILLQEHIESLHKNFQVNIFATDIDSGSIQQARTGVYPASIAADVSPARLSRYFAFDAATSTYRVNRVIRDMLIFSEQDLTRDPPFSRLDLISCRNLLIYFGADLQKRLIPLFHYSLLPNGYLALGASETIGSFSDLFHSLDRASKIFQRLPDHRGLSHPSFRRFRSPLIEDEARALPLPKPVRPTKPLLRGLVETALLDRWAPAAALVTQSGEILYLHGRSGMYLEPVAGEASLNILNMARQGLRRDLTFALHNAALRNETVRSGPVQVKTNGDFTTIDLEVQPLDGNFEYLPAKDLFLISFQPVEATPTTPLLPQDESADARILTLQQDLVAKDEYLRSSLEQMETANEELRSSHEEMQSINEELQSTNEELETSKEELQSVNEELATVNVELQQRVNDLSHANNDMNNLLAGTGVGTIFVDHQLRIQRFTPAVTQVINLIATDIGRPVSHIASNLIGYTNLIADIEAVLNTLTQRDIEVETNSHSWFLLRIRPYRTLENVIEGAVILFFDITELVHTRQSRRLGEDTVRQLAATLPQLLWTFTAEGVCDYVSPQWTTFTGESESHLLGIGWLKRIHSADRDRVIARWNQSISSGFSLDIEFRLLAASGIGEWFHTRITPLRDPATLALRWFAVSTNIESAKRATLTRQALLEASPHCVLIHDAEGRIMDSNIPAQRLFALQRDQLRGLSLQSLLEDAVGADGGPLDWTSFPPLSARRTGQPGPPVRIGLTRPSTTAWLLVSAAVVAQSEDVAPFPVITQLVLVDSVDKIG